MENQSFFCSMCCFSTDIHDRFVAHVVRAHRHDSNFVVYCGYPNCPYTTKTWGAFKTHVSRKHRLEVENVHNNVPMEMDNEDGEQGDPIEHEMTANELQQLSVGKYCLALETDHNMTQRAVNDVLLTTSDLLKQHADLFRCKVRHALEEQNLPGDFLSDIDTDTFVDLLSTTKKRDRFYADKFKMLKPVEARLGSRFVTVRGKHVYKPKLGYFIPFKENLQRLLSLPEVWHYIQTGHKSQSVIMRDICDGSYLANHELFVRNEKALQIIMNTDDIEIVNPIGAHTKKHKLSLFYFTLGNIPPEYRSKLTCIQLIAVAKARDVKNLRSGLLADFIGTMKLLATNGIQMEIKGSMHTIEGTLVMAACDTLAANWIGGFKEGVAFAFKACRTCTASGKEMKTKFLESDFQIRSDDDHRERCETLNQLSRVTRKYWSKMWGINSESILNEIPGFSLCSGLVHDPMHLLLEGVVSYELRILLYHFVHVEKYFTLRWLNARIVSFPYGYLESGSKPEKIDAAHINGDGKIKQTSASMLTLCITVPFIIGLKVPETDARWKNFVRLIQILILATSPCCDWTTSAELTQLIFDHHHAFARLYPKVSIIPKMHYMVHLPSQMIKYGPLRNQWCMRFEGKHSYFKTKNFKCFKNLPKTLCLKHQKFMCHKQTNFAGQPSDNFLYHGDIISEGTNVVFGDVFPDLEVTFRALANAADDDTLHVYRTSRATIHGHCYRTGCCLVLDYVEDVPVFAKLQDIVVKNNVKYFVVEELPIVDFNSHILAFELQMSGQLTIKRHMNMFSKWPLTLHMYKGKWHLVNQYSHRAEYL